MDEYLVNYGRAGDFARFRPADSLTCGRGDRVVVRTDQGIELGVVLCAAEPGHARFLSRTACGDLLRIATEADNQVADQMSERGQDIFEHARQLACDLGLPLEVVDVDVLFDGAHAVVYHLRRDECDYRPLVSSLARAFDLHIVMVNLFVPTEREHGCGKPDCGGGSGGCSTCGTGGGCSSCGAGTKAEDVSAYLANLQAHSNRHPLL
jgi:cell fate regulator YaaT (PSP1 superfamily)